MEENRLEGRIIVKDLKLFLEKSKQGINLVYQLHRQLGEVFVDASFQDKENPSLLYKMRIPFDPPKLLSTDYQWDEHGFPYELETYQVTDGSKIIVPLYRPEQGESMSKFLEDIAEYELLPDGGMFESAPAEVKASIDRILAEIERISEVLDSSELSDCEKEAVDVYFGEAGIFNVLGDAADGAIVEFLRHMLWSQGQKYAAVQKEAQEKRRVVLIEVENQAINKLETLLKTHNFKQGYVSTEVIV